MSSNILLKNISNIENIKFENNQQTNVFLVANNKEDIKKDININLFNNNLVNIYCLILANHANKTINININHFGNKSISNIYVKALANNKSIVKVNCISNCQPKTRKNILNQTIDGLIFDNESIIQALPCLDINTDDINAKHTVNIGQIDPEIIFYLNTKGLSTLEAYQFLIDSFIHELKPYIESNHIDINKEIKVLVGDHYE